MTSNSLRRRALGSVTLAAVLTLLAACTGATPPRDTSATPQPTSSFTTMTPKATSNAGDVEWAVYREVQTLDPIMSYDYPENTVLPTLCDSLLRTQPNMSVASGLATYTASSPTEFDFTINSDAKFWDGSPVTADDAVFSLQRAASTTDGSYFSGVFDRVAGYDVTGQETFRIRLKMPDYWLIGNLASTPGTIVEKKYVEAKGNKFGTPAGGTMCSGPFKLASWQTGQGVKVVPNPGYWDKTLPAPRVSSITFVGTASDASLTAGLDTGAISGSYLSTSYTVLRQLQGQGNLNVYQGAPFLTAAMLVTTTKGPLADVRVRQALQLAVDRPGISNVVFGGAALTPHALQGPGTWGYAPDIFKAGYDALPAMGQDLTKAKSLVTQAGVSGATIRILTTTASGSLDGQSQAFATAAEAIGLKVQLKNVSLDLFNQYFFDPKLYGTVDALPTVDYGLVADPTWTLSSLALPGGSLNLNKYANPQVTALLNAARQEKDVTKRAQDVVDAQKLITSDAPWIPMVLPNTVLVMNKKFTGVPATAQYLFGPWAVYLGGS